MPPNMNKYARRLSGYDLPDHEKSELIHSLWRIVESFVERAFTGELQPIADGEPKIMDSAGQPAHVESIGKPNNRTLRTSFACAVRRTGAGEVAHAEGA